MALLRGLPSEAATWQEDQKGWTQADELAASQIEIADAWGRQIVTAVLAAAGARKLPEFGAAVQIEHPGRPQPERQRKRRRLATPADIARLSKR